MLSMIMVMAESPEEKRKIEKLYERYQRLMYVVSYQILNKHEDAEDAVLASWEKIIRHLDKISEIDSKETKSFLVIIVERTSIDLYRKNRKRTEAESLLEDWEVSPYFATKDRSLEEAELSELFRSIPKKYSEVLFLHYINGATAKEIADMLNIKENAVNQRLHRGREHLKKMLE